MWSCAERRRLLDRISLYVSPVSLSDSSAFVRSMKERQRALEARGPRAPDLDEWETLLVRHGVAVMEHRRQAAALVAQRALYAFARIAAPELALTVSYAPSAPGDPSVFLRELRERRVSDQRRGSAGIGPHRDELTLSINGRPVRGVASQGQHRAVTLALKSAEVDGVGEACGARPIVLLDVVSSELDRTRTASLFSFLREQQGQVFLSTTRPELIDTGEDASARRDFVIKNGKLSFDVRS